jgi:creatinine deaminase
MLVLSRQRDQTIMIGDEVEVTVVDMRGDKVRLGITAPKTVAVHRKEIYEAIRKENQAAANVATQDLSALVAPPPTQPVHVEKPNTMDPFLRAAVDEAKQGLSEGGLPIGSVLVRGGQIVGRGHNRRVQNGDPMAHAEIDCLKNAGRQRTYKDTVLYSTLMPCFLCTGAVIQFGVPKVIVGESVNFPGGESRCGKSPKFMRDCGIDVVDLHDNECIEMMSRFIREHPALWNEDIGVE